MQAITYRGFGPPDVLELREAERPEAGTVTPLVDRTYPLAEAADALRHLGEGHARGKLVVSVAPR
jgi:Zinc-binding dehydrogenase